MKINLLCMMIVGSFFSICKGQVGIGTTTPDNSSILHLNSNNKGLLITSIALNSSTDATTIPSPATGLLIWNNGTGGLSATGFYYWNNSQWNLLNTGNSSTGGSTSGWNTTGNNTGSSSGTGTTLSIGTASYDDLVFKVSNNTAGRLSVNNSVQFGIGTSASQNAVAIGTNAKANNNESTAVGNNSSAAGYQSLALGHNSKTASNSETAIGYNSETNNQNSTALGSGSKGLGQNSISLGYNSQTNAYNSTALGSETNASGQNSTAIGYGATTSQANAIVIGNSSANIGIGTSTPNTNAKLDVNGQYKFGDKGSIHKNQISFEVNPSVSITGLQSGRTATVDISVPTGLSPNSTRATVVVSPANDFVGVNNFAINNPRLISTSVIRINLTNVSNGAADLNSGHFYVTINEF